MISELVIITPEVSPGRGGVADHTRALLRHWRPRERVRLLIASSDFRSVEKVEMVGQLERTSDGIVRQLPGAPGKVLVQYSAYGFSRFGYPRELIRALIDWKARTGGRLVIIFHEIWTFWPFPNKNFFLQQLHRRALRRLLKVCDVAFTTTDNQAGHLRRLWNSAAVQVLPVGSNIRRKTSAPQPREEGSAVLFGLQANRLRSLENVARSLAALAASGRITRIICVGHDTDPAASHQEAELLGRLNLRAGFSQTGALSEDAVSDVLCSVQFGIFGQNELSCTKSGSFMAYAAHQMNVLADFANASKPPPICWLVGPAELVKGVDLQELDRRAQCLRMWQEQNSSWRVIADKAAAALGIETTGSASAA